MDCSLPLEIWESTLGGIDCIKTIVTIRLVSKRFKALIDASLLVWQSIIGAEFRTLLRPQVMMKRTGWSAYDLMRRSYGWKRFPGIFGASDPQRIATPVNNYVDLENWKRMQSDITLLAWVPWEIHKEQVTEFWDLGDGTIAAIFGSKRARRSHRIIVDSLGRYTQYKHDYLVAVVQKSRYIYIHQEGIFCWEEGRTELTFICKSPFPSPEFKGLHMLKGMTDYLVFQFLFTGSRKVYAFKLSTLDIAWEFSYVQSDRNGYYPFHLDECHVTLLNSFNKEQVFILDLHDGQLVRKFRKEHLPLKGESTPSIWQYHHYLNTFAVTVNLIPPKQTTVQTRIHTFHFNHNQSVSRCNVMTTAIRQTPYFYRSSIRFQDALVSSSHWQENEVMWPGVQVYDAITCSIHHYSCDYIDPDPRDFWNTLRFMALYRDETGVVKSCVVSIPFYGITKKKHKKRMMNNM